MESKIASLKSKLENNAQKMKLKKTTIVQNTIKPSLKELKKIFEAASSSSHTLPKNLDGINTKIPIKLKKPVVTPNSSPQTKSELAKKENSGKNLANKQSVSSAFIGSIKSKIQSFETKKQLPEPIETTKTTISKATIKKREPLKEKVLEQKPVTSRFREQTSSSMCKFFIIHYNLAINCLLNFH